MTSVCVELKRKAFEVFSILKAVGMIQFGKQRGKSSVQVGRMKEGIVNTRSRVMEIQRVLCAFSGIVSWCYR